MAQKTIQDVTDYWNRQPCNIKHSLAAVGTKRYFDEVEARKYTVEPHIPGFAEFNRWSGKNVLEIGCGIGTDAVNFKRAGATYIGIDVSQESVALANQRLQMEGFSRSCFVWNAEDQLTPITGGYNFDLIYSFGVIHHTPNPRHIIKNARRVIKHTGELRIMLYADESWKSIMIDAGLDQFEAQAGCPIADLYTWDQCYILMQQDFGIKSIEQTHIFPYKVGPYKEGRYEREDYFAAMSYEMFRALEQRLGWHLLIKAVPIL